MLNNRKSIDVFINFYKNNNSSLSSCVQTIKLHILLDPPKVFSFVNGFIINNITYISLSLHMPNPHPHTRIIIWSYLSNTRIFLSRTAAPCIFDSQRNGI